MPSFRPDVRREVDVTEEVARRIGYQELPDIAATVTVCGPAHRRADPPAPVEADPRPASGRTRPGRRRSSIPGTRCAGE